MGSASRAVSIYHDQESAPTGQHSLATRMIRKTFQKICPSTAAILTSALCFMGTPYSAYGQSGLLRPTVTLTASPNPSNVGDLVTFTVTVSYAGATVPPGGSITISEYPPNSGVIIYGKPTSLTNGEAVVTTNALTTGAHVIWATYGGDPGNYQGAQQQVTQVVKDVVVNEDLGEPLKTVIPVHLDASTGAITVGSTVYKGASAGMHLLAFKRSPDESHLDAPDVIQNGDATFHDASSANQFLENILSAVPNAFLIVNAPGNYGFPLNAVAKNLEKFGAQNDIESVDSPIPFVLLGNGGRNMGQALQRGNSNRNVDGYLAKDSEGNYTFIQTDYVRYDITTDGTITIGDTTYTVADSYKPGCNGDASNSFHLLIVHRETLQPVATPAVNNTYCTAQSDSEIHRLATDLPKVVGNNEGLLVFLASNGNPIPANWNFGTDGDARIYPLAKEIARLGGYFETMIYLTPKDTYSLVGAPAPPIGTPGASNRARESSSVYPEIKNRDGVPVHPTGELHGVLARGLRGDWYSPLDADTTGLANLGLYQILAQTPVPFPHPANNAELAAFQYINQQLCKGSNCALRFKLPSVYVPGRFDQSLPESVQFAVYAGHANAAGRWLVVGRRSNKGSS